MKTRITFRAVLSLMLVLSALLTVQGTPKALADSTAISFDSYTTGTINGQDGWSKTGSYDVAVVANTYGYSSFGAQSLRISNAVTSGSFGDHTFSKPLVDEAGETAAYVAAPSGTRQGFFSAQWDFASTVPGAEQSGLSVVASPDMGDGGRMSWIQMTDTPSGLEVNFYDYQDAVPYGSNTTPADGRDVNDDFAFTNLASGLDRTVPHTIRIEMNLPDGPHNDVVMVYVDGVLRHTGTSWEDYFRWMQGPGDPEATAPVHESRVIRSMLFRTGGTAVPATLGNGFLIDNLATFSGPAPTPSLAFNPTTASMSVGGSATVNLDLNSVVNLYGYQFQVNYDATKVSASGAFVNSFFDTTGGSIPGGWSASCASGVCKFAVSKVAPGGAPVTGSGTLAQITFTGTAPGIVPLTFSGDILSDRNGTALSHTLGTATLTVNGSATLTGTVNLQGRTPPGPGDTTGTVTLTDTSGVLPPTVVTIAANGSWFASVPVSPGGTTYQLDAAHSLYLGNRHAGIAVLTGDTLPVPTTTLKGGDADNSGLIDVSDLTCIGGAFGGLPAVCGATGNSDINADGAVNILDLVLAGGNYGLATPQPW